MPIFEYICEECQHQFEALVFGHEKAICPKCDSKKLSRQLSVFAVSAKGSSGAHATGMPSRPCGSCGDPRGRGACSLGEPD
ncbi:MAG: zinc ribbon domain-containing protein [Candidatus Sulfotelmatobacter sp.]